MKRDREKTLEKVKREIQAMNKSSELRPTSGGGSSIKRTLTGVIGSRTNRPSLSRGGTIQVPVYTDQDIKAAVDALHDKWDAEIVRMQSYLTRNHHLARGLPWGDDETTENQRPRSAETLGDVLRSVKLESTPTLGKELKMGWLDEKVELSPQKTPVSFSLPEE